MLFKTLFSLNEKNIKKKNDLSYVMLKNKKYNMLGFYFGWLSEF